MRKFKFSRIRFTSSLIVLMPILYVYSVGSLPVTFGDVAVVLICVMAFLQARKNRIMLRKCYFVVYFLVAFFLSIGSIIVRGQRDITDFLGQWLKLAAYYFVIDILSKNENQFDFYYMQRFCVLVGMIISALLFFQVIMARVFSKPMILVLPFLPLTTHITWEEMNAMYTKAFVQGGWRPFSIFYEPAHFATAALLPLAVTLFCKGNVMNKKQKALCAVFLTAAIFTSRSAIGIFISSLLLSIWYIRYSRSEITIKKVLVVCLFVGVFVYVITSTDYFASALKRVESVFVMGETTGTQRLLQGFAVFSRLSALEKIFGCGFGNIQTYLYENKITTVYLEELGNTFMNSFSIVLVSGGVFGFLVFLIIWFRMFIVNKDILSRAVFIVISIVFCTSGEFYSCISVMYLTFVQCLKQELATADPYEGAIPSVHQLQENVYTN